MDVDAFDRLAPEYVAARDAAIVAVVLPPDPLGGEGASEEQQAVEAQRVVKLREQFWRAEVARADRSRSLAPGVASRKNL